MDKNKIVFIENEIEETLYKLMQKKFQLSFEEGEQLANTINKLTESYQIIYEMRHRIYGDGI